MDAKWDMDLIESSGIIVNPHASRIPSAITTTMPPSAIQEYGWVDAHDYLFVFGGCSGTKHFDYSSDPGLIWIFDRKLKLWFLSEIKCPKPNTSWFAAICPIKTKLLSHGYLRATKLPIALISIICAQIEGSSIIALVERPKDRIPLLCWKMQTHIVMKGYQRPKLCYTQDAHPFIFKEQLLCIVWMRRHMRQRRCSYISSPGNKIKKNTHYSVQDTHFFLCLLCDRVYTKVISVKNHIRKKHFLLAASPSQMAVHCENYIWKKHDDGNHYVCVICAIENITNTNHEPELFNLSTNVIVHAKNHASDLHRSRCQHVG
eukprot:30734_1